MPHILVVEDDALVQDMLVRRLRKEGYEVSTANDGAAGISKARAVQPHIILMDVGLPVLNGWQAIHRLKRLPQTCHIPIILLTAYALTVTRAQALQIEADEYEAKPVIWPQLLTKIQQLLERPPANQPTLTR